MSATKPSQSAPTDIAAVVSRMEAIAASLAVGDGVARFNHLYLAVTPRGAGASRRRLRGCGVPILNPSHGTFHPKLYVARHGDHIAAAIGSANLTSGLVANVEVVAVLQGHRSAPQLQRPWELAVHEITPDGVWVETLRSRQAGRPPQLVPAWMIQIAWDWLQSHGTLTNRFLLSDDGLNVKRSSFVCALLARLPDVDVDVVSSRPIELGLRRPVSAPPTG